MPPKSGIKRRFEFVEGASKKFWEVGYASTRQWSYAMRNLRDGATVTSGRSIRRRPRWSYERSDAEWGFLTPMGG